jgi:ADP-heptose:LPS heptosyltransferase
MLCAVPALRALRTHLPAAHVTLIGLPWAREMVDRFPSYLDDFLEFPGYPGLPEQHFDSGRFESFLAHVRSKRFDAVIQLHGSGAITNDLVSRFGARSVLGFRPQDGGPQPTGDFLPLPAEQPEILRLLSLVQFLGAEPQGSHLEFAVRADEKLRARQLVAAGGAYVCIHPGARYSSRRWAAGRYAAVADGLAARGARVVLTGSNAESCVTAAVRRAMMHPAIDVTGRTTLGELAALLQGAAVVVSNDTGVAHLAVAVGAPSVVVSLGSEVRRWAPLDAQRHQVVAAHPPCRPCEYVTCPIPGHPCAAAVEPAAVLARAASWLQNGTAHAGLSPAGDAP